MRKDEERSKHEQTRANTKSVEQMESMDGVCGSLGDAAMQLRPCWPSPAFPVDPTSDDTPRSPRELVPGPAPGRKILVPNGS